MSPPPEAADQVGAATLERMAAAPRYNRWMFDRLRPWVGRRVLEIGAGIGNMSAFLVDREHDPLAVDQERRHVANSGPDLEHPAPHPGAQPVEHPAIVAGGRGHALERRGPDLIRRLRRGGHRLRSGSAYDTG